jgi:broad specificity phosphatase PhoE
MGTSSSEGHGRGPERLWVVRHGQSTANLAAAAAEMEGAERLELTTRDMDAALSPLGTQQAAALGRFLSGWPAERRPDVVLASPYLRARQTAAIALAAAGGDLATIAVHCDERLRDREMGALDGLTMRGVQAHFPELAAQRARIGKFYQRPPGGEAWTDVLLRLRSVQHSLELEHHGKRVLIFAHDIVVLLFCYLYEELDEAQVVELGANDPVANCSLTSFVRAGRSLRLEAYNEVAPISQDGTPVTAEEDEHVVNG